MKKLSIFLAFLVAMCSLSSCEDKKEPIYNAPTAFQLNTPALSTQLYELSKDGTVTLSWSQPDYGYAAVAKYSVDLSLTQDFKDFISLDASYNTCVASVNEDLMAVAICKLQGYTKDNADDYPKDAPVTPVYLRVKSLLDNVAGSEILSNVIELKQVRGYKAIEAPGFIYFVGKPEGWAGPTAGAAEHYADWRLFEADDAIGSKIYTGVFNINAGEAIFRFYTALTGWDADSYGSQVEDNPVGIELNDGLYNGELVKGKGAFEIPNWEGGSLKITVDMSKPSAMTVKFEAGGEDYTGKAFIYLVGAPADWAGPDEDNAAHYADWKLYDMKGDGVYTRKFDIPAEKFQFRFYKKLSGWDGNDSYGSQEADSPVDITFTDNVYSGACMDGKGSWNDPTWAGGKVSISVDTNTGKVTFTKL